MEVRDRARVHAALGDPARLEIVDALRLGDCTVSALGDLSGLPGNLLAHHLDVLEAAGLIERRRSEGDGRRRYIVLRSDPLALVATRPVAPFRSALFVCTHNSARSQFAAALWHHRTGEVAESAGTEPARRVHPTAAAVAAALGIDLAGCFPRGYEELTTEPDIVISVCDRAGEAGSPRPGVPQLHWSIPDPVTVGTRQAFRDAFGQISDRIDRLAQDLP